MSKPIRQTVTFKASPKQVYEMLMDSKKHAAFTGEKAAISRKVGGRFTAYGTYIEGENVMLQPDRIIVQEWRGSGWPEGHTSVVVYDLQKVKGGTKLIFTHVGVPENEVKAIAAGWKEHYWDKMKKKIGKK